MSALDDILGGEEVQRLLRMGENIGQVEAARVRDLPDVGAKDEGEN